MRHPAPKYDTKPYKELHQRVQISPKPLSYLAIQGTAAPSRYPSSTLFLPFILMGYPIKAEELDRGCLLKKTTICWGYIRIMEKKMEITI